MTKDLTLQDNKQLTHGERFTNKVLTEFQAGAGSELAISDYQKRLIQNYFVAIDSALKTAEQKRLSSKYNKEKMPVSWENINMNALSVDVVSAARVGLDPAQKNHINFIPFKNNSTGKYEIVFIEGYVGLEYKAKKYALEMPLEVVCELVYSNDKFKPIKRGPTNAYESYEHDIDNPFERGEVIGGFTYFIYPDPNKNRLMIMTKKDILKRKPKHASAEFWGGEKDKWENGQKVGKEHVEGWFEEMALKTIKRAAYNSIPIDPQKVDEFYQHLKRREKDFAEYEAAQEIAENANSEAIDITYTTVVDKETGEVSQEPLVLTEATVTETVIEDTNSATTDEAPADGGCGF